MMKIKPNLITAILFVSLIALTAIVDFFAFGAQRHTFILAMFFIVTLTLGVLLAYSNRSWKTFIAVTLGIVIETWFAKMTIASIIWHFNGFAP